MSAEFWTDAARMTTAGLLVAQVAVPVGVLAWAARPPGEPLLPRWRPWRVPWSGFEVALAFVVVVFVLPVLVYTALEETSFYHVLYGPDFPAARGADSDPDAVREARAVANTVRGLWAGAFALPLQLAALWGTIRTLSPQWKPAVLGCASLAGKVRLAVLAWLAIAPVVLVLNTGVNELSARLGTDPEAHPLTKLARGSVLDRVLFGVTACVVAPVLEEVLIRGLLLAWCIGRTRIFGADAGSLTAARPWFVMVAAGTFAVRSENPAAWVFAALLALGLGVVWRTARTGARRVRAVYATAAFFALMHSTWPNPVPLFVLGLGLGWLAVRTNGILVPVIVHGLFNAVSAVFLLRGGVG